MKSNMIVFVFADSCSGGGTSFSILFLMISMVMLAAMITILIDRYIKDKFLAISIIFAIASIVLAVGLILYMLDKRSAQRKAQSIYFVEH
jgi:F0F1-type ATP synthase assembly protein I